VDHLDPFAAEHLVEGGAELPVSVVDQEPCPLEEPAEAEVARLLADPGAGRVAGAAGEVDAAASELDEKEHVVAAQAEPLDGKEIARQRARRPWTQELAPAWPATPRRRRQSGRQQQPPEGARRDTHAELQQLTGDPRVSPARVLPRQTQNELANARLDRWPSRRSLWLRPST